MKSGAVDGNVGFFLGPMTHRIHVWYIYITLGVY